MAIATDAQNLATLRQLLAEEETKMTALSRGREKRFEGRLMRHQDIEYTVVQTANPFGWKWSFDREGLPPKTGISDDRAGAILAAERAINQALKQKHYSR